MNNSIVNTGQPLIHVWQATSIRVTHGSTVPVAWGKEGRTRCVQGGVRTGLEGGGGGRDFNLGVLEVKLPHTVKGFEQNQTLDTSVRCQAN